MFSFCWVRMAGAFKIHLFPILISSKLVRLFFESMNSIPENLKRILVVVISYLLFRVYSTEQLMINAATKMAAVRMEERRQDTSLSFHVLWRTPGDMDVCTLEQAGSIRLLTQFTESRGIEVYPSRC